jgi:hypothetical protein
MSSIIFYVNNLINVLFKLKSPENITLNLMTTMCFTHYNET